MTLAELVAHMRAAGVRTLTLGLDDGSRLPPGLNEETSPWASGADTQPPESLSAEELSEPFVEPEFAANPGVCAFEGCGEPSGGIIGGRMAHLCRKHAFLRVGIK